MGRFLSFASFDNCAVTCFTTKVFPVPVFPYKNRLEGFSDLKVGASTPAICAISSSLCKIVSGKKLYCKDALSLKIDSFFKKFSKKLVKSPFFIFILFLTNILFKYLFIKIYINPHLYF